jgi:acetoin utilization deacetylase AcuC-like enzyme
MPRALRRLAARLRRRLSGRPPVDFVVAPQGCVRLPAGLLDPWRGPRVLDFLEQEGLVDAHRVRRAQPARSLDLARIHDLAYLEGLEQPGSTDRAFGMRLGERVEQRVLRAHRAQVGATIEAAARALETRGVVVHPGGGFHHARRDRAAGFCLFNDVAIAIARLRENGFAAPIAVVDLDLHDGDGTRSIFAADASVHTFSIHSRAWDDEQAVESTSIELGTAVEDARLLETLRASLPPLLDRYRPRLAFYLAGVDVAEDDDLGDWLVSADGIVARDAFVMDELGRRQVPAVVLLAGGYGENAWRHAARSLSRLCTGRRPVEPPTTAEALVSRFRGLARELSASALGGFGDELLTAEDLEEVLGGGGTRRFLGFYTNQGIELALERLGYFAELRALGFDTPVVELDPGGADGDILRVFGAPDRRELLVELRARRDRRTLPPFELLWLEWLLLQNPRAGFTAERPRLPGQTHPGLGMLRETMTALVLVCDRLKLDGIGVTAAHFHPAAQSLGEMHLLEPNEEAAFAAACAAVRGLPIPEAARRVEVDGLVEATTGEIYHWQPLTLIYPVSAGLRDWFAQRQRRSAPGAAPRYLLRDPVPGPGRPAG